MEFFFIAFFLDNSEENLLGLLHLISCADNKAALFFLDMQAQAKQTEYNTIQYNTIQYNTIQYNTIQYNTIQYNTIQQI